MSANGMLRDDELTKVGESPVDGGKGLRLANLAARAWNAMVIDAAEDGVALWPASGSASCYRSVQTQRAMHSNPSAFGLNPSMTVSLAPVNESTHGWGTRVDIGSVPPLNDLGRFGAEGKRRRAWLLANAPKYGWKRTDFPDPERDHNHFTHDGKTVRPAALEVAPIDLEDIMQPRTIIKSTVPTPLDGTLRALAITPSTVSLVEGPARIDGTVNVAAQGVPSASLEIPDTGQPILHPAGVVQARLVRTTKAKGKDNVDRSEGVGVELVGNGGGAYGQLGVAVDLGPNEFLRVQMNANTEGVTGTFLASLRIQQL